MVLEPCDFYYHHKINTVDVNHICSGPSKSYLLDYSVQLPNECPGNVESGLWINGKINKGKFNKH